MHSIKKRLVSGLMLTCFLFVNVVGAVMPVELEHTHTAGAEHHHHHHHHDHGHDHDHLPVHNGDSDGQEGETAHSHVISLNVEVADSSPIGIALEFSVIADGSQVCMDVDPCPDSTSFGLMKPPQ